jgi:hypothetical protein
MFSRFTFILAFITVLAFSNSQSFSQESNHLWTMTFLTVPNDQITEFMNFYEKEGKPADSQNEHVLSTKIFTHTWGPAWTICLMTEYKDWDGFHAADKRATEIFTKMYPETAKGDEVGKTWSKFLIGHSDAIVFDNQKLQK